MDHMRISGTSYSENYLYDNLFFTLMIHVHLVNTLKDIKSKEQYTNRMTKKICIIIIIDQFRNTYNIRDDMKYIL